LRGGHEQFEFVPIGIAKVDPHASDRATYLNVEPSCEQVRLPGVKLSDGGNAKRDVVERQLTGTVHRRTARPQDKFER